jgi:hypothetical protein
LAAAAAILLFQVLLPPAIGMADNGDFGKIIGKFNLYPAVDDLKDSAFRYIDLFYNFRADNYVDAGFHSSETLPIRIALGINRLISHRGVFDLRTMGAVHALLFLLALALLLPVLGRQRPWLQAALAALAVLVFCDTAYAAYYNSFYLDTGAFLFLMLAVAALLRALEWRRPMDAHLALLFALLLVTAKTQHALLAIPLAMFFVWERNRLWARRALLNGALAAVLIAAGGVFSFLGGSPPGYTAPCLFNMIFAKLLPTAKDPAAELASLGLDRSYLQYSEMDAFMDRAPMRDRGWRREFLAKTSFARLAAFYVTHPGRALEVAESGLEEAALGRPPNIGNYDRRAGLEPFAQSDAFALWSTGRNAVLTAAPWLMPLIFAASLGVLWWRFRAAAVALGVAGAIEFGVGAMTDASEVTRHLFLFNAIWDLTLLGAVAAAAIAVSRRFRQPKEAAAPAVGTDRKWLALPTIGSVALVAAAAVVIVQILVPPVVGLGDNTDFQRILGPFSLGLPPAAAALRPQYIDLRYESSPAHYWDGGFRSTEHLLAAAAVGLNALFARDDLFHLRFAGIVHASLLLLAFACFAPLLRRMRPLVQAALLALAIFFFCDVMYSTFYNSFYMDTAAFLFLLLAAVFLARAMRAEGRWAGDSWLAVLCSVLMLAAKTQHALLAIPLLVFVIWQRRALWPRRTVLATALAGALIGGAGAFSLVAGSPAGYANPCLFNIIFGRLLPGAENPSAELASLGLDDSYLHCVGMDLYSPDAPMEDGVWRQQFQSRTSFPRLARFYIEHPVRALSVAYMVLIDAARQRPGKLGNYPISAGRPPSAQSNAFAVWSDAKQAALGAAPWLYLVVFALALGVIARRLPAGAVALFLMGAIEFGISGMTDSDEVTRHVFLFNAIWDIALFAALCVLAQAIGARSKRT